MSTSKDNFSETVGKCLAKKHQYVVTRSLAAVFKTRLAGARNLEL